jgi:hypothetical protein
MPSANWPLEKIGKCCTASFLCFGLVRLLLEKLLVPAVWPKFKTLDSRVQKDFCVRCTSVVVRRDPNPASSRGSAAKPAPPLPLCRLSHYRRGPRLCCIGPAALGHYDIQRVLVPDR